MYIGTAAANVDITINAARNSINEWSGSISDAGVGRHTVRMTKQNSGEYVLPNDEGITMTLTASGIITYDILAVRWSDTGDAYRHIGSVESSSGPSGPFGAFTLAGTPSSTNTIPKWTDASTLTWSPDLTGATGSGPFNAFTLGGTPQAGYVPAYTDASNLTWTPVSSGYPTVSGTLPTTLQANGAIIYYVGSSTHSEGIYRWSGSEYLPGPRVLDFRSTNSAGTVTTTAEDVDSATFSNAFDVSSDADVSLNTSTLAGYALSGTPTVGDVVEFTSGNYPTTGGLAFENVGAMSTRSDGQNTWPAGTPALFGEAAGLSYAYTSIGCLLYTSPSPRDS